ncbi:MULTISPECIES: tRNA (guanosine(37)-N1)-methyltransferase TrmD [Adlercreutzia]|mgnify:CR=1 FL=1|uniref:tRNA (guanine-N(1)-)-methyltransferase n=1 Tax=Adlercreutzia hattorii TaxID=2707299 RepID=A0A6F8SK98_9ACTN|nr:tRNA (guanosine(37)-N1)-methyltransferase TrmD [Adlercreutzia hattorii]BCA88495.1 tRNA (guanine-N(1)-)-methyltransferase [Adlercreutzia hattorii]
MLIETLSTFPHMYDSVMGESMMKRAQEKGILEFRAHDLRDWTHDRHRTTDDDPYGGGAGLVMKCEPIFEAVEAILGKEFVEAKLASAMGEPGGISGGAHQASSAANAISPVGCRAERGLSERLSTTRKAAPGGLASSSTMVEFGGDAGCPDRASSAAPQIVFLAPQGRPFDDAYADKLAAADHLLFICGHYEGIDERVYALADHVISLGDYVLTSGELASMVVIDAAVRKLPGVLGAADGPVDESFTSGLLEYPQYTRPADFRGMRVPEVLTSGNHAAIARWRREQSLARTAAARPDLIAAAEAADLLTPADQKFLKLLEPAPTGAAEGVS